MAQEDRNGATTTPPSPPPQLQEVLDAALAAQAAAEAAADAAASQPVAAPTNAAASKATPVDADLIPLVDSAASFVLKKLTWANLKATLKTYFDTLYFFKAGGTVTGAATFSAGLNMTASLAKWAKGANVASASNLPLVPDGNSFDVTGSTTVNTFASLGIGSIILLHFNGALTLVNSVNLVLPMGVDYLTAAGDELIFVEFAAGQYRCIGFSRNSVPSMVRLNTANGYGSTNTMIRRFTNQVTNQGSDITYTDSATLGASFTINTNGVYAISYNDQFNAASDLGLSLNSSQLTTVISSVSVADILASSSSIATARAGACTFVGYLPAGSVVRPHTAAATTGGAPNLCQFTITRVQ